MNHEKLYKEYLEDGGTGSYEDYLSMLIDFDVKKKDQSVVPTQITEQMSGSPMNQQDSRWEQTAIPQDQFSSDLASTENVPSTELDLTETASFGTNLTNPLAQLRPTAPDFQEQSVVSNFYEPLNDFNEKVYEATQNRLGNEWMKKSAVEDILGTSANTNRINTNNTIQRLNEEQRKRNVTLPTVTQPASSNVGDTVLPITPKDYKFYQDRLSSINKEFDALKKNPLINQNKLLVESITNLDSEYKVIQEDKEYNSLTNQAKEIIDKINEIGSKAIDGKLPDKEFNEYQLYKNKLDSITKNPKFVEAENKQKNILDKRNELFSQYESLQNSDEFKNIIQTQSSLIEEQKSIFGSEEYKNSVLTEKKRIADYNAGLKSSAKGKLIVGADVTGLKEVQPYQKTITDNQGKVVAKTRDDIKKFYKDAIGQDVVETDNGIFTLDFYLNNKDEEGNQKAPDTNDYFDNVNGIVLPTEKPIDYGLLQEDKIREKGVVYSYGGSEPNAVKEQNRQVRIAEQNGNIKIWRDENNVEQVNEEGNLKYYYINDEFLRKENERLSKNNEDVRHQNKLKNYAMLRNVQYGAMLEEDAKKNTIAEYGQAFYDKYGALPTVEAEKKIEEERIKYFTDNGYSLEQARNIVYEGNRERAFNLSQENGAILNNINGYLDATQSKFNYDVEKINSEKDAWKILAENYPKEFNRFFGRFEERYGDANENSITGSANQLGNKNWEMRFSDPLYSAKIKDDFLQEVRNKRITETIEITNKSKQEQLNLRKAAQEKNYGEVNNALAKLGEYGRIIKDAEEDVRGISEIEDYVKPLFKDAYDNEKQNAKTNASADRGEIEGILKKTAGQVRNIPFNILGKLMTSVFSQGTFNSQWSKNINEGIEFGTNVTKSNKDARSVFGEVTHYTDKNGNKYVYDSGNLYKLDENGNKVYDENIDTNAFLGTLTKGKTEKEFSPIALTSFVLENGLEMYIYGGLATKSTALAGNFLGVKASAQLAKYTEKVGLELAKNNRYYKMLNATSKWLNKAENTSPLGFTAAYSYENNKRNEELGYDRIESFTKGIFDGAMMYFANRFFPDVKIFKDADSVQKSVYSLLKKGNREEAWSVYKNFFTNASYYGKHLAPSIAGEEIQENILEPTFQGIADVVSAGLKGDRKEWKRATSSDNFLDLSPETILITAISTGGAKANSLYRTKTIKGFDELSHSEAVILATQNDALLNELRNIARGDYGFSNITTAQAQREIEQVETAKKYLNKIPNKDKYSVSTLSEVVPLLQKKERLERELKDTDDSMSFLVEGDLADTKLKIKEAFDKANSINTNNTTQYQSPNNNTDNTFDIQNAETAQSTPQQEATQRNTKATSETPTTESEGGEESSITNDTTNQPEQTTVEGEQGVSTDIKPIRQLGDGVSNVYFETDKYRVNDKSNGRVTLNIQNDKDVIPVANIEFDTPQEAVFVAKEIDKVYPSGVPDALLIDKYVEQLKKQYNETQNNEQQPIVTTTSEQPTNQSNEIANTSVQSEVETTENQEDEDVTEAEWDDLISKINNKQDETIPRTDTANDGGVEPIVEVVQQDDTEGKESTQGVSQTPNIGGGESDTEVEPTLNLSENQYERNGKVYTRTESGDYTVANSKGIQQKVTTKKTIEELDVLHDERNLEEAHTVNIKGTDYEYKLYKNGEVKIINKYKGTPIKLFSETKQLMKGGKSKGKYKNVVRKSPLYSQIEAQIFGVKTDSQTKAERDAIVQQYLNETEGSTDPTTIAMRFYLDGGGIAPTVINRFGEEIDHILSETGESKNNLTWIHQFKQANKRGNKNLETFETTAEKLTEDFNGEVDSNDVRSALIDVAMSNNSLSELKQKIVDKYTDNRQEPQTEQEKRDEEIWDARQRLNDKEFAIFEDVISEELLSPSDWEQYFLQQNELKKLTEEQYEQESTNTATAEAERGKQTERISGSEEENGRKPTQSEATRNSPEYKQLIQQRGEAESEVKSAKDNLDRVSKATNTNFQADQENLFGERATSQEEMLFDERADGEAGKQIISEAKSRYDKAKSVLSRVNSRIKDFESGKTSGTGEIDFNIIPVKSSFKNTKLYQKALDLFNKNVPLEKIWKQTGMFLRQNTKDNTWEWAFRIDQNKMKVSLPATLKSGDKFKLSEVVDYPEFYNTLPKAKNIEVRIINSPIRIMEAGLSKDGSILAINLAHYDINTKSEKETKNLISHELQHLLQLSLDNATLDYKITSNERANYRTILEEKQKYLNGIILNSDNSPIEKRNISRRIANIQNALDYLDGGKPRTQEVKKFVDSEIERLGYYGALTERESRLAETEYNKSPYESYNEDAEEKGIPSIDFEAETQNLRGQVQSEISNRKYQSITLEAFEKLFTKLASKFPMFGKLGKTFDFNEFKAWAKEAGVSDVDIQRMVMAFHGSPHSFDRFTTDKMGTGEGAQYFGWGLYFTDIKGIAEGYAKQLSQPKSLKTNSGEVSINEIKNKVNWKDWEDGDINRVISTFIEGRKEVFKNTKGEQKARAIIKYLEKVNAKDYVQNRNLYQVSLHKGKTPEQYAWLEWDKPLSDKLINSILKSKNEEVIALLDKYKDLNSRIETNKRALDSVTKERNLFIDSLKEKYNEEDTRILQNLLSKEEELKGDESAERWNTLEQERKDLQDLQKSKEGRYVYENLKEILGSDKEASLFLLQLGIDGVKYPAESISRGATSDNARGFNYVVFDENAVTIEDKIQFMQTKDGETYGAVLPDGRMYFNPEKVNANTAIHEFSHLWEKVLPKAWSKGLDLFKQTKTGKEYFDKINENKGYENLTQEQKWSEAMNTFIGDFGEKKYQRQAKGKMAEFVEWLKNTFQKLGEFIKYKGKLTPETKFKDFANGVIGDLMGGKPIVAEAEVNSNGNVNFSIVNNSTTPTLPHKNLAPAKTIKEVANTLINGSEADAMKVLRESSWFKNSSQKTIAELEIGGVKKFVLEQMTKQKENAKIKAEIDIAKEKEKAAEEVKKVKAKAEKTIEGIKEKYERKIQDLKEKNTSLKQKQIERKQLVQQTIRELKATLLNNTINKKITPTEVSRLIKAASEIAVSSKPTQALNSFFQLYTVIQANAESRMKAEQLTRTEYNELKTFVEALRYSGVAEDAILEQVKYNEFPFSKKGVLNERTERATREIIKRYDVNENANANDLFDEAYQKSKDAQEKTFWQKFKANPMKAVGEEVVKFIEDYSDRGFKVKEIFSKMNIGDVDMVNVYNRFINAAGSSSIANNLHDKYFDEIFAGLSQEERVALDKLIVARRIVAIEKNLEKRDLIPILHTNGITLEKAQEYLDKLKDKNKELSDKLNQRADVYFKAFDEQLDNMLKNGIISQDIYDSIKGVEYQPRKFLQHMADYQGVVDENNVGDNYNTGKKSVSKEPIKKLDGGSEDAQVMNADWLLRIAISANARMTAMNDVNASFMTEEFPKARVKAEEIKAKQESKRTSKEKAFLKAFTQMNQMVKDNPIVGVTENGNPKYKETSTPNGFTKNYYFVNGVRHEFFIADEINDIWNDIYDKPLTEFVERSKIATLAIKKPTSLLKYMATGINPLFAIANTPRDFFQVLNFSNVYSKAIPKAIYQLGRDSIKAYIQINKYRSGKENTMVQKAMEYGVGMDFLYIQGQFENQTRKESGVSKVLDKVNVLSYYSELGTRIAVFSKVVNDRLKEYNKDKGTNYKSVEEIPNKYDADNIYHAAVTASRSIMDFNQGGKKAKDLDVLIPYLNAGIQGTRVTVDAFRKRPIETSFRVLQTSAMMTGAMVSISMLALGWGAGDDDDDTETSIKKYLDFIERITPTQKMNYWNIPIPIKLAEKIGFALPEKKDNDEYYVLKLAKTQSLTPFLYAMEETVNNVLRSFVGRETKNFGGIAKGSLKTASKNMLPFEVGSPLEMALSVVNKVPIGKAAILYGTGYDHYKGEMLSSDIGKVMKGAEGLSNDNIEDFYKNLGSKFNISPARSKAVVESFVTSPQTNPYVSLMYFGTNSISNFIGKKDREYISEKMVNDIKKTFSGRVVSQTSSYAVSLSQQETIKESKTLQKIGYEDAKLSADKKKWAKEISNGRMTEEQLETIIDNLDKTDNEKKNIRKAVMERVENKDVSPIILNIRYDYEYRSAKAKAQKLIETYPDIDLINDNSEKAEKLRDEFKQVGGVFTDDVKEYYEKMKKK